jgi:hypothetical protein
MGKADNIKRAKKIKEAKRKREQDAIIAAAEGPAGQVMRSRIVKNGFKTKLNDEPVKYSELLKLFVQPIIMNTDNFSIIRTKYLFAVHVWNTVIMRERSEDLYQMAKKDLLKLSGNQTDFEELFNEMEKRKKEEFNEFKNIIADMEIKKIRGLNYDLTVATTSFND